MHISLFSIHITIQKSHFIQKLFEYSLSEDPINYERIISYHQRRTFPADCFPTGDQRIMLLVNWLPLADQGKQIGATRANLQCIGYDWVSFHIDLFYRSWHGWLYRNWLNFNSTNFFSLCDNVTDWMWVLISWTSDVLIEANRVMWNGLTRKHTNIKDHNLHHVRVAFDLISLRLMDRITLNYFVNMIRI